MGILVNAESGRQRVLSSRCLVGRASHCLLRLSDKRVSGEHARIRWSGGSWCVRDLGSRNGTYVNGERLSVGQDMRLLAGTSVAFGEIDGFWTLQDCAPPSLTIERLDGSNRVAADHEILVYPGAEQADVMIFQGASGHWYCEQSGQVLELVNGQELEIDGDAWRVLLPQPDSDTWDAGDIQLHLSSVKLHFTVSRDEETIALSIAGGGRMLSFPPRSHHYTLLTLARLRSQDESSLGLPAPERGWIYSDHLTKMLGVDQNGLNVSIYRARRQLAEAGILGAANIVERRVGTGQLRLGTSQCYFQETTT